MCVFFVHEYKCIETVLYISGYPINFTFVFIQHLVLFTSIFSLLNAQIYMPSNHLHVNCNQYQTLYIINCCKLKACYFFAYLITMKKHSC